jgi:hypothetical protein
MASAAEPRTCPERRRRDDADGTPTIIQKAVQKTAQKTAKH